MERVEGGPDFKKKNPHFIKVLCEVQTTVEGQESHPPLAQPLGVFGGEFNALVQERTRQVEKEGRETPDSPPPTRPSVRPSGFRFNGRRRTPVSSHIKYYKTNRRRISATDPPSLCMATLKGWEGGEGEGRLSQILFKVFLRLHIQVARCLQVAEEYL